VCVVGRVTQIKRPDRVADVARILAGRFPDLTILVAGAGDLEGEQASRVAAEQLPITMLGWRDDVETIFAASDLALLTSDNEGTPLSLIQAALAGIPSVATDVGAVHEVVLDGTTGLLTPCDPELIADAVTGLLESPERREAMGEAGRIRAEDLYTVQRFADEHGDLYESLIAAKAQKAG
jgi:glycosyltransferase involved in cell wall biosynthesis